MVIVQNSVALCYTMWAYVAESQHTSGRWYHAPCSCRHMWMGYDAKFGSSATNGMDADRCPEMGTWTPPTLLTGCLVIDGTFSTIILFERPPMTSYWRSVVIMALSGVVSEIFNVEKYRDLEIPVSGQSRSFKVVLFNRLDMVSY